MNAPRNPKKQAPDRLLRAPVVVAALLMLATPVAALGDLDASSQGYLDAEDVYASYDATAHADVDADVDGAYMMATQTVADAEAQASGTVDGQVATATEMAGQIEGQATAQADAQAEANADASVSYEYEMPEMPTVEVPDVPDVPMTGSADAEASAEGTADAAVSYGGDLQADVSGHAGTALPDTCQITSQVPDVKGSLEGTVSSATQVTGLLGLGADLDALAVADVDAQPVLAEVCQLPGDLDADLDAGLKADADEESLGIEAEGEAESTLGKIGNVFVKAWAGLKGLF